jgi:hypothetical protein
MKQKMLTALVAFIAPLLVLHSAQAYPDRQLKVKDHGVGWDAFCSKHR